MLYTLARSALFRLDPEVAHDLALKSICALGPGAALLGAGADLNESRKVMGLQFPNPVGLAAGFDKNGEYIDGLAALGFGSLEIGTVTPRPQPGNPKPRMFRLVDHEAIINRLGFNNVGVEQLLRNVERSSFRGILGINIGKNFDTPIERAADDYLAALEAVYSRASYVAVNISSPNTKNLRDLQSPERLDELLGAVMGKRDALATRLGLVKPLAVKVAPDLDDEQVAAVARLAIKHKVDALIATNTTLDRDAVAGHKHAAEAGGLSGRPVFEKSTSTLRKLSTALGGRVPLIGVGGILSGADAKAKIDAGASLVQLYTGFIYRGPGLIADARRALRRARYVRIGVPRETKTGEHRVGLTPQGARALVQRGHEVWIETLAGSGVGYDDADYLDAGADAVGAGLAWNNELVVKVKELQPGEALRFQPGSTLFSFHHLAGEPERTREVAASRGRAIAFEMVRDAEGQFPLLATMSRIAGRMAIPIGAGLRGARVERVLVLGGGHAGRAAADAALGHGASVTLLCHRESTRDRLRDAYAGRAIVEIATPASIEAAALEADVVVGAVFVPATPTPKLLPRSLVRRMRRGAVIVDVSIDAGGVAETSRATTHAQPSFVEEGVTHYCVANIPAADARAATDALAAATLPYVIEMADKGVERAVRDNLALRSGVLAWDGVITDEGIAREAGLRHRPLEALAA